MDKFFLSCDTADPGYICVRDLDKLAADKEFVEQLWLDYQDYADSHFREDAKLHFQERFWEMYLGNAFLQQGFEIDPYSDKGPEFYLDIDNKRVWIEAIAPGPGDGPDAVPEMECGKPIATRVPEDEIILRLTHAICAKHKIYLKHLEEGLIKDDEPYVLAINSKRIRVSVLDSNPPLIIKAVYPLGNLVAVIDRSGGIIVDTHHEYRDHIHKKSGSSVSTDIFLTSEHSGISAVLYSSVDAVNRPDVIGKDFRLVHNKMARNPLPPGTFRFGTEHWAEDDELKSKIWS